MLVLTSTYPRWKGDSEPAFVHSLCQQLAKRFDVCVVCPYAKGARKREVLDGVEIRRFRYLPFALEGLAYDGGILPKIRKRPVLAMQVPFFVIGMFFSLVQQVRRTKPRVIHVHWILPQGLLAFVVVRLFARDVKLVITSHGADLFALNGFVFRQFKRMVLRGADVVTVVSEPMARFCREKLGVQREIISQSMGVDIAGTQHAALAVENRHGLIFVGRLVKKKGCAVLLEALAALTLSRPDLRLLILGDGPERRSLEERAEKLGVSGNVTFLGAVNGEAVETHLHQALVAVMPSLEAAGGDQEGLGLVAVEALLAGCIPITSDLEVLRQVIDIPMLRFQPGDPQALARRIADVLDAPADALDLCREARQHASRNFCWDAVGAIYSDLIEAVDKQEAEHARSL